jgi:hypothetical protein
MTHSKPANHWILEELVEGYSAMAKDIARESEAQEWSEGLIGDAFADT